MKRPEAKKITEKIIAIILEEQNRYSKEEARRVAPVNEGHALWTRIEDLLTRQGTQIKSEPLSDNTECAGDCVYPDITHDGKPGVCVNCRQPKIIKAT